MKLLYTWLAGLLLALAAHEPAFADDVANGPPATATGCFSHYAEWKNGDEDNAAIPPGTWTKIQTCTVGGHQVRINTADWPVETYQCGAAGPVSEISVWVDGVKVVNKRETGLGSLCFEMDQNLVSKIIVNDQMHLTVCEMLGASRRGDPYKASELKPGQQGIEIWDDQGDEAAYFIEQCTLTTITPSGGKDPYFTMRTQPGTVQIGSGDAMCPAIQARFVDPVEAGAYATTLPSALDAYKTDQVTLDGKPYDTASEADKEAGSLTHYRLDVDHDGVVDTLILADRSDPSDLELPPQYSWISGKTGQTFDITSKMIGDGVEWNSDLYPDPIREEMDFVAADGKVWFYVTAVGLLSSYPAYDVTEVEQMSGATDGGDDPAPSRVLYEFRPDGTARIACRWGPRPRPEEFL